MVVHDELWFLGTASMGGSPGELSEELCDVGEAKEGLENEL